MTNIKSIRIVGKAQTYDLEVNHSDHQYYLSNGMLTSNSHATLYSMISFETAYYKANFPLEFLVANLKSEVRSNAKQAKENIMKIKEEIRALGVQIVPPDINQSETTYKIIDDKTLMTGLDSLKYMGKDAIPELLSKRPFTSFKDLMTRVDASKVRAPTIQSLAASGCLDKFGIERHLVYLYCSDYRNKLRAHVQKNERAFERKPKKPRKRKAEKPEEFEARVQEYEAVMAEPPKQLTSELRQQWVDEFEYPWPKETPWNIRETFAMEEFYMGEGITGTVFERYDNFLKAGLVRFPKMATLMPYEHFSDDEKTDRKANTTHISQKGLPAIKGIITNVFSFKVKKEDSKIFGQEMARLTINDPWGNPLSVLAFPETWVHIRDRVEKELSGGKVKLEVGLAVSFTGLFQWENSQTYSFIIDDILDYKEPPTLPTDRKSKKVKMPRGIKLKKEELEEMQKEELAEALEDEMVDSGISPIDDDDDEIYEFP